MKKKELEDVTKNEKGFLTVSNPLDLLSRKTKFDNLFDIILPDFTKMQLPKTNLVEKEDHYELTMEMPGFKKNEIDVVVDGDNLIIQAQHTETKDEDGEKVLHERSSSSVKRMFTFPGITKEDIDAKLKDGILELNIAKKEVEVKALDRVEIK